MRCCGWLMSRPFGTSRKTISRFTGSCSLPWQRPQPSTISSPATAARQPGPASILCIEIHKHTVWDKYLRSTTCQSEFSYRDPVRRYERFRWLAILRRGASWLAIYWKRNWSMIADLWQARDCIIRARWINTSCTYCIAKVRRKSVRRRRSPDLEQIALRTQSH